MSKKFAFALVLVGLVSACQKAPEPIPAPIVVAPEPVYQGKFGAN